MEFYSNTKTHDKNVITFDDANHEIMRDKQFASFVVKDLISFFDTNL